MPNWKGMANIAWGHRPWGVDAKNLLLDSINYLFCGVYSHSFEIIGINFHGNKHIKSFWEHAANAGAMHGEPKNNGEPIQ